VSGGNRPRQSHEWPDEASERLRALWLAGATTRVIGAELGVSRNAVVGKARRLDLPPRPNPKGIRPGGQLPPPRPRPQPVRPPHQPLEPQQRASLAGRPPAPPATPPTPPEPPPARAARTDGCMWPMTDDKPWRFCGAATAGHGPYCRKHQEIAWIRRPSRGAEAAA
jgi:GcrA cell cycle regulator